MNDCRHSIATNGNCQQQCAECLSMLNEAYNGMYVLV